MFGGLQVTPVIKNLVIANVVVFAITELVVQLPMREYLSLYSFQSDSFMPHQLVTHFFMHASIPHLLMNMFVLWMLGSPLEMAFGQKRFLTFYVLCAIGAGVLYQGYIYWDIAQLQQVVDSFRLNPSSEAFSAFIEANVPLDDMSTGFQTALRKLRVAFGNNPDNVAYSREVGDFMQSWVQRKINSPMVGASGAVFGILAGFALLFPNQELMLLFLPVPIKAKYFVLGYAALELFSGIADNPYDNVAHFAHLAGALVGYILIKAWRIR